VSRWPTFSRTASLGIAGIAVTLAFFGFTLVKTAWVCDDAFITMRTVDNLVNGYGLTWNTSERVQAYSNPLWMFVISGFYAITLDAYHSCVFVSMGTSILAVFLLAFGIAKSRVAAAVGILILTLSKAFTDYSTSGLENPLTFLLLSIFFVIYFGREKSTPVRLFWLSFTASLGAVNRLDTFLIFLPPLVAALLATWRTVGPGGRTKIRLLGRAALGFAPLVAWEAFSVVYYGFLFPNTAYAKLNTGIPTREMIRQGAYYFLNSVTWDPLTLSVVAVAAIMVVLRRDRKSLPVVVGVFLYLVYILRIGGDFMSGRYFAAPLFCAVALMCRMQLRGRVRAAFAVVALVIGLIPARSPIRSDWDYVGRGDSVQGITDERGNYSPYTGLLKPIKIFTHPVPHEGLRARFEGPSVKQFNCIGFYGYMAGPEVHIVDGCALADPLLARLPMEYRSDWRVGHYYRKIPEGYLETLETGEDRFRDRNLAAYNQKLRLITRGDLFDIDRWKAIVRMNLGHYDDLIDVEAYR